MIVIKPDQALPEEPLVKFSKDNSTKNHPYIFLAGSIEQDKAEKWQDVFIDHFKNHIVTIFNPRRNEWNSNLEQSLNNTDFVHQVNWELDALEQADLIAMYIDPKTMSPITLLEFGKYYDSGKLVIACPHGFWRRGNIEVMCRRQGIFLHETLDQLIHAIESVLPVWDLVSKEPKWIEP